MKEAAHPEANIIFGTVIDDTLGDEVRVTVIAAGFDSGEPSPRIEPVLASRPVVPPLAAPVETTETAAEPVAEAKPQVPVPAGVSEPASYDSAFGDDDLDIPDFLK